MDRAEPPLRQNIRRMGGRVPRHHRQTRPQGRDSPCLRDDDRVYASSLKAAVLTGARAGELAGANLGDIDLPAGTFRISRHYDRESGSLTLPKNGEARVVYLIPPAVKLFTDWLVVRGDDVAPDAPLFEAPRGGRVNTQFLAKVAAKAMESAKPPIPKLRGGRSAAQTSVGLDNGSIGIRLTGLFRCR